MKGLGPRLKRIRVFLNLTQVQMADAVGVKYRSWQDYEKEKSVPGGKVLAGIARLGVNTNWLLTGEGALLARPTEVQATAACGLMQTIVNTFQDELERMPTSMSAAERRAVAQAFASLYERLCPVPNDQTLRNLLDRMSISGHSE